MTTAAFHVQVPLPEFSDAVQLHILQMNESYPTAWLLQHTRLPQNPVGKVPLQTTKHHRDSLSDKIGVRKVQLPGSTGKDAHMCLLLLLQQHPQHNQGQMCSLGNEDLHHQSSHTISNMWLTFYAKWNPMKDTQLSRLVLKVSAA